MFGGNRIRTPNRRPQGGCRSEPRRKCWTEMEQSCNMVSWIFAVESDGFLWRGQIDLCYNTRGALRRRKWGIIWEFSQMAPHWLLLSAPLMWSCNFNLFPGVSAKICLWFQSFFKGFQSFAFQSFLFRSQYKSQLRWHDRIAALSQLRWNQAVHCIRNIFSLTKIL